MAHLAKKTSIAAFARPAVLQTSIENFEEQFAQGREWHDVFSAFVTRSFGDKTANELGELCVQNFSSSTNSYHPFFFIVLDDRTNKDGSILLYHQGDSAGNIAPRQELRAGSGSLASLITLLNTGMRDIPSILRNDGPQNPHEAETWFYNVPLNFSATQLKARVSTSEFTITDGPGAEFHTLVLGADGVVAVGLPRVSIELVWFGECPQSVLLQSCWSKKKPDQKHVTGERI